MTPEELAQDPAVRAAVFATVTREEASSILHSRAGKPWCDAWARDLTGLWPMPEEIRGDILSGVDQVLGSD